jgi:hypothetical protein
VHTAIHSANRPVVASVEVVNDAPPPKGEYPAFGSSILPAAANTAETVASDLPSYFAGATVVGAPEAQRVIVRIEKADAYWVMPVSGSLPVVGILTLGGDREFFMNMRVSIEVEMHGKVVRTFASNERFSISDGKTVTQGDIEQSYRRLVARYREQFFGTLDKTFTERYLD